MKKIAFSVLATSALATIIAVGEAEASSYTVKSGDSLWKIASDYGTTVSQIKELNSLSSDFIFPNQVLELSSTATLVSTNQNIPTKPITASIQESTYTVLSGDTLSRIAVQFKTTVSAIQLSNNISNHLIFPGQVLKVGESIQVTPAAPSTPIPAPTQVPLVPTNPANTVYTIVSGDTLSGIAYRNRTTVDQLMKWNNLTSTFIRIGQKLSIGDSGEVSPVSAPSLVPKPSAPVVAESSLYQKVIQLATSLQGTPYEWGGSSLSGFDCSGYIYYVFKQAGLTIPRTNTSGYDARSYDVSDPQPGDLVFFSNTYRPGISHMGIYIGNNQFIHAGGDRVQITSLSNSYWKTKFDSFKRFYAID